MAMKKPRAGADVRALLDRIAELEKRVMKLEAERDAALVAPIKTAPPVMAAAATAAPAARVQVIAAPSPVRVAPLAHDGEISEETLMVISAAVAAFLGKRAHVRQIRLVGSGAWAEQGRVSIMASHRWAMQRG
jgi:hypothetical protein